jgi:predicted RNA-binding Zn ribbon-like protein
MTQRIDSLRTPLLAVLAISIALPLLADHASAAAMRCSGEQKTCIANCDKSRDRSKLSTCLTSCGARQSTCMKTGCWNSGVQKYCGLLKQ